MCDQRHQSRQGFGAPHLSKCCFRSLPWGDSDRYDLIVDAGRGLVRVQVKSAHRVSANPGGGYHVRAHGHVRRPYKASEIDFLVAYVVPEDVWYVFPADAFMKMKSMRLFPRQGKKGSKFEKYREAWELFEEATENRRQV